jgi:hypothetical protein
MSMKKIYWKENNSLISSHYHNSRLQVVKTPLYIQQLKRVILHIEAIAKHR